MEIVTGEFMPTRGKPVLLAGLSVSMFTFAVMTFGQNVIGSFDGWRGNAPVAIDADNGRARVAAGAFHERELLQTFKICAQGG